MREPYKKDNTKGTAECSGNMKGIAGNSQGTEGNTNVTLENTERIL